MLTDAPILCHIGVITGAQVLDVELRSMLRGHLMIQNYLQPLTRDTMTMISLQLVLSLTIQQVQTFIKYLATKSQAPLLNQEINQKIVALVVA